MGTLHIAPGDSSGGSLAHALREAGQDVEVLRFRDDLSCGPIDSLAPATRAAWWDQWYEGHEVETAFNKFQERITTTEDRLIVWFSRHSASEFSFFLALNTWLGERPFYIVDVTGQRVPVRKKDGSMGLSLPTPAVGVMPTVSLVSMLGKEAPIATHKREESKALWRRLQREKAPFRVVTGTGLVSAEIDHFDPLILAQATPDWQSCARIIGHTMGYNSEPYHQVGDVMLHTRLVALVEQGRLLADGEPSELSCRVRLPTSARV